MRSVAASASSSARHSPHWPNASAARPSPSSSSSVSCSFASLQLCISKRLISKIGQGLGFFSIGRESRAQLRDRTPNAFLHCPGGTVQRVCDLFVRHAFVVTQQKRESLRWRQLRQRANHVLKQQFVKNIFRRGRLRRFRLDLDQLHHGRLAAPTKETGRSEERRVGKECRSRWSP